MSLIKYLKETPLKSSKNCLRWWSKNSYTYPNLAKLAKQYPNLAKLAKQYLYIPASLVPAEQVFSVVGEIVNTKRANL